MNIEDVLKGHGVGGGGSNIKSIQSGKVTLSSSTTTLDIPITTVNMNNSIVMISLAGNASSLFTADRFSARAELTSNSNVRLTRSAASDLNSYVTWTVIEFQNIKSLQKGTFTQAGGWNFTKTINSVNRDKSFLVYSFSTNSTATNLIQLSNSGWISSATQLTFDFGTSSSITVNWQVIEFN